MESRGPYLLPTQYSPCATCPLPLTPIFQASPYLWPYGPSQVTSQARARPALGPQPARTWPEPSPHLTRAQPAPAAAVRGCCCGLVRLRLLPWHGAAAAVAGAASTVC